MDQSVVEGPERNRRIGKRLGKRMVKIYNKPYIGGIRKAREKDSPAIK